MAGMTGAQRLKRVFNIDIETCSAWGGAVRLIDCIEHPLVIEKILAHLGLQARAMRLRGSSATRHVRADARPTAAPA